MGIYLNPGETAFQIARNSQIYVDKSELIRKLNQVLKTEQRFVCISRPRRFGKSMAANMVCAYYDRTANKKVFAGLSIVKNNGMIQQGKFNVLRINMQEFLSETKNIEELLSLLKESLLWEMLEEYPDFHYFKKDNLRFVMDTIAKQSGLDFVVVIDEWDCIFREYPHDGAAQKRYLDFLRDWLKDKTYIALAYMVGGLPVAHTSWLFRM